MIHLNIGSNLNSKFGDKFRNISIAINLLIESEPLFSLEVAFELTLLLESPLCEL